MKIVFLFVAIYFTIVNTGRAYQGSNVLPLGILLQVIGIVGFITLHFNLM